MITVSPDMKLPTLTTHLFSTNVKAAPQIAPSFTIAIPLRYIGDHEEVGTLGAPPSVSACLQEGLGQLQSKTPQGMEGTQAGIHPSKREIEQWYGGAGKNE